MENPIEILIPKEALIEFLRFSEGRNDQAVRCSVTENHLFFVWKERLLLSRKLGGSFPNYERVLPKQYGRSISLERKELRASIERVSSFSDTKTRCVVVEVSQGQLALRAEDSNVGESEEVLPVTYNDEPVRIGFNGSYLADFLARADHELVQFLFQNGSSAAELRPGTSAGSAEYRYIVMPMAIREQAISQ